MDNGVPCRGPGSLQLCGLVQEIQSEEAFVFLGTSAQFWHIWARIFAAPPWRGRGKSVNLNLSLRVKVEGGQWGPLGRCRFKVHS